jgi:hypothetical protein
VIDINSIDKITTLSDLITTWNNIVEAHNNHHSTTTTATKRSGNNKVTIITPLLVNKMMVTALAIEQPNFAIDIFEETFGFSCNNPNPAKSIISLINNKDETVVELPIATKSFNFKNFNEEIKSENKIFQFSSKIPSLQKMSFENDETDAGNIFDFSESEKEKNSEKLDNFDDFGEFSDKKDLAKIMKLKMNLKMSGFSVKEKIKPNNFVCTTAIKAYGRVNNADGAVSLFEWFESQVFNYYFFIQNNSLFFILFKF